ncbi:hypothetical protein HC031_14220 [Planosporangium thailandense]|uniref:RiboL-PSP-HEPN domain-containing protein n=1 Tax=Planosporangium thailandense TaxID=765197 RepID=A0ABX0Y0G9_9ACTN|nr:hypothetical protein [Planosporangium thailandense]NJC70864.1 hypothetical protein [Planosporangium thailandense]
MAAVDDLLQRLRAIDRAIDALSEPAFNEQEIQDHLIRGIAVNGLVCVESFLRTRMREWVSALAGARVPPSRLPGGTKQYEDRLIEVLPRSLRDQDVVQRSALLDEVGKSLTSLSTGIFVPHALAFSWSGYNVQSSDIESIASLVGVERNKVWSDLTRIWQLVDQQFPGNSSLKRVFEEVAELRHIAAHSANPNIPIPNLTTISRNVKIVCLCVDILASFKLRNIMYVQSSGGVRSQALSIKIRRIVRDGGKWPEYAPGVKRAAKRHNSLEEAMQLAAGRARLTGELVLATNSGDVVDWSCPIP